MLIVKNNNNNKYKITCIHALLSVKDFESISPIHEILRLTQPVPKNPTQIKWFVCFTFKIVNYE